MDLSEFVYETLTQIVQGVAKAQAEVKEPGAKINPKPFGDFKEITKAGGGIPTVGGNFSQPVEFDVALTVTEGSGTRAGIGVFVGALSLGSAGQSQSQNSSVSRVKFTVSITLPGA